MLTASLLCASVLFVYPFVLYPLWVKLRTRRGSAESAAGAMPPDAAACPALTLVICALNEEKVIQQKLENCQALRYPREKLRVIVISDGSTDGTATAVRRYESHWLELRDFAQRRGKIACLNEAIPQLASPLVVLSDANVMYHPDALLHLVAPFRDPAVGAVSGKVILHDTTGALDASTDQYYSLEWMLQQQASDLYSLAGADGAMYAFRRELFQPCPNDTIIEDFVIPMGIVRQGYRVLFQGRAIGWEQGVTSVREEYRRRVRIAAGAAQALVRGNGWPGSQAPLRFWLVFLSHKLLRWFSPVVLALVVILALLASGQLLGQLVLAAFVLMLTLTLLKLASGSQHPLLDAPFYFLFSQAAVAAGLFRGFRGRQTVLWAKANR